jgi:hypothetical protein
MHGNQGSHGDVYVCDGIEGAISGYPKGLLTVGQHNQQQQDD